MMDHMGEQGLDSALDWPLFGQGGGESTGSEPIFQEMQLVRKES